jgi:hypothetical protein
MKATVGKKIKAYKGNSIGKIIQSTEWQGEIIKVNKKSIRVRLSESTSMWDRRVKTHCENLNDEVSFRFVKTLSNGNDWYLSEGRLYGGIEI